MNVFLPSMHGTKVGFMRDILSEAKSCLKQNEVNHMEVPCYQEISVKNLYADAMKDELLGVHDRLQLPAHQHRALWGGGGGDPWG